MTIVTLAKIEEEQARLATMIAELKATAPTLLIMREAQIELRPGELYAGLVLDADGLASHHLVLLPGEAKDVSWQDAKDWAAALGGELPTRQEQALLYANRKAGFQSRWYWSCQEHESDGSYAWLQLFTNGDQSLSLRRSFEGCARAVRRLPA